MLETFEFDQRTQTRQLTIMAILSTEDVHRSLQYSLSKAIEVLEMVITYTRTILWCTDVDATATAMIN